MNNLKIVPKEELSVGLFVIIDNQPQEITPELLIELLLERKTCKPIHISEEFLKKNGFLLKGKTFVLQTFGNHINVKREMDHYRFYITGEPLHDGFFCPQFNDYIKYVHQFQTACRLCRISKKIII